MKGILRRADDVRPDVRAQGFNSEDFDPVTEDLSKEVGEIHEVTKGLFVGSNSKEVDIAVGASFVAKD